MSEIISLFILISLSLLVVKIFTAKNVYERILGVYFAVTNGILLILINAVTAFDNILEIVIILLLLQLMAVLFLLLNKKKA